ncbi:MAG TPA: TSUP family transporter [Bacteroidia bacterium]|nr:TSUP family transporter [Bacteroidia bacterium]
MNFVLEKNGLLETKETDTDSNELFPVFLKLDELRVLIIGGGNVALEKLQAILSNSPSTEITLVGKEIRKEIVDISREFTNLIIFEREVAPNDFEEIDVVFIAVNDFGLSEELAEEAHSRNLLVNVADTPALCDFYLSSVVRKGDLKIAISTNGKSPTLAKRLREVLQESIPEETQDSIEQLNKLRTTLKGDFAEKVKELNKATAILLERKDKKKVFRKRVRMAILYSLSVLSLLVTGHLLFTYIPFHTIGDATTTFFTQFDSKILLWILGGFIAQMIDGALGMAYGVSASTFLLAFGISPAIASASMHASEVFTSGTSSLYYLRYKNINLKLFRNLFIPGAIGAVIGAVTLSLLKQYMIYVKPFVAAYTLILGVLILRKALKNRIIRKKKFNNIWPLAATGGFLDAAGGGGWGPIVTSTLVAGGRDLRYTIGSAHAARTFVALMATLTYTFLLGLSHWEVIVGLVIGAMIAAPISVWLSTKISVRNGLILVGFLVIIISLKIIIGTFIP